MKRRTLLRTAGLIGASTLVGAGAFSLSGAASGATIRTNDTAITNDDGVVRQVLIDPQLHLSWSELDNAVGQISVFIEARTENMGAEEFYPVTRAQLPILPEMAGRVDATPGTTGEYLMRDSVSAIGENLRRTLSDDFSVAGRNGGIVVADAEHGRPDYESAFGGDGVSRGYLEGSNVYGATIPDIDGLMNGEYGAVAGTEDFEQPQDGASKTTGVELRYTIAFLRPSLDWLQAVTGFDVVGATDNGTIGEIRALLEEMYDESAATWSAPARFNTTLDNAGFLSDVMPRDITVVGFTSAGDYTTADDEAIDFETNQCLPVMLGQEHPLPESGKLAENPAGRDAEAIQQYAAANDYPGFIVQDPSFAVTVNNEAAEPSGQSGGGASGTNVK